LHGDKIPQDLLLYPRKCPKSPFNTPNSPCKRLGLTKPEPALRLLQRCSIVHTNRTKNTISIHPFLQFSTICYLSYKDARDSVDLASEILLSRFPRLSTYQTREGLYKYWTDCEIYISHIQHLAKHCNRWPGMATSQAFIALQLEFMVATQTKKLFSPDRLLPLAIPPMAPLTSPSQDFLILSILYSSYTRLSDYIALPTVDVYPYPLHVLYAKYVRIFLSRMSYLISTLLLEPLGNLSINLPDNHLSSNITINNPQSTAHPTSSIYQ
jgi:hypothetical protein